MDHAELPDPSESLNEVCVHDSNLPRVQSDRTPNGIIEDASSNSGPAGAESLCLRF